MTAAMRVTRSQTRSNVMRLFPDELLPRHVELSARARMATYRVQYPLRRYANAAIAPTGASHAKPDHRCRLTLVGSRQATSPASAPASAAVAIQPYQYMVGPAEAGAVNNVHSPTAGP